MLESRNLLAAVSFSGNPYTQTFDGLGTSLSAWANDSTLPAWSLFTSAGAAVTAVSTNTGVSSSGSFYNFGSSGASDRALGGVGSGGTYFGSPAPGAVAGWMAVAIINATGSPQASFTLRYDGEQWRNGGNTATNSTTVEYGFGASFATVTGWTSAGSAFTFTSPQVGATAAALDGNAAANRVANVGGTITPASPWAAGSTLWVRWAETNEAGNDHGMAIDNVSFSLPTSVVTPPTAPTITTVTPGDGRLTVAFSAPGSNGGGLITGYQYSLDDGGSWLTPSPAVTSSPLVITGLVNGTTYGVRIRAVNSAGAGAASLAASGKPVGTGTLRIVSYNITAADTLPRAGLGTLVQAMSAENYAGLADQVDLLAIQEVQSQSITSTNVAATLNAIYGSGTYSFGALNGATTGSGTQGVVYNAKALQLLDERAIGTASTSGGPRQTLRYAFQPKDGDATTVFYVYVSHFKSLDTTADAARRDAEATVIRADADALPAGSNILYVGDFNLYRSSEPAYQTLLAAGGGQAFDPLDRPGDWHSNSSFVDTFTQAPLTTAPSGFTGGGLDDRFDFQLVSGAVMAPGGFTYLAGSYRTFGNNGSVPRNGSINAPTSTALAGLANRTQVLDLLTTVSDHLPVVADYSYAAVTVGVPTITVSTATLPQPLTTTYGTASTAASFTVAGTALTGSLTVTAPAGFEVSTAAGSGYGPTATLSPSAGNLTATPIYVRLAATAAVGSYDGRAVTIAGGGAPTQTVTTAASGNAVSKAAQTIVFSPLPTKVVGDAAFTLSATASSGLAVSYASSNPAVATVSGSTVTIVAAGSCVITASQPGDGNYLAAADVPQTLTVVVTPPPATGDLLFSEYVEGSSNNKYLEIYNAGSTVATLSDYEVRLFGNGSATATQTQPLGSLAGGPTTLAPGATLVIANASAALALPAGVVSFASSVTNFNGDDALAIWKVSTAAYVDIFGTIGSDPGTAWTSGSLSTLNATLRRTASVTAGVTVNPATFATLATEWEAFPIDTVSGLGSHSATPPVPASIAGVVWVDADADGIKDPGEGVSSGWTVFLDQDANGLLGSGEASVVTGSSGGYAFTGLAAGTYRVTLLPRGGWEQTSPASAAVLATEIVTVAGTASVDYAPAVRQQATRSIPNDPLFASQWHLNNTGQSGGTAGEDARLPAAWNVATGTGVVIGIVDDGLQGSHPDLAPNFRADLSYDFNGNDADPTPGTGDDHGTSAAGVAAARGNNGLGVSGSAPNAGLAGIRLISTTTTDQQEANGLSYRPQDIDIYSNSWGPADDGLTLEGPGPLTRAALANAVRTGRGGLGSIYVWAAGNGLDAGDNSNYDGYANSRYTIAVSAVDHRGRQSWYSEPGANILVASPSSGGTSTTQACGIVTTDRTGTAGYNTATSANGGDYANDFGGTSSATPLVSGVVALMLEANPNLGWRDVQHVLARSARRNDITDVGWSQNAAGRWINDKYGFGEIDAAAAVGLAKTWTNVAAEVTATSGTVTVGQSIPDASATGITSSFTLGADVTMESVELTLTARHASRGNLRVVLTSPSGTRSVLADQHADTGNDYLGWTFSTVRNWGESSAGTWTLTVSDLTSGTTGTFDSWSVNVYGTRGAGYVAPPTPLLVTVAAGEDAAARNFGVRSLQPPATVFDVAAGQTQADTTVHSGADSLVKQGAGTLVISGGNTHTGGVTAEAGEIIVRNVAALGTGPLSIASGARVTLDVAGAGMTLASLAGAGLLDVGSGRVTVGSGLTGEALRALIVAGRGDGTWNGAAGISSATVAAAVASSTTRSLGWLDNGDGSYTIGFAAPGDSDLDGQVDVLDIANVMAGGSYGAGVAATWAQGDFTYDGFVDILDVSEMLGSGLYGGGAYGSAPETASAATSRAVSEGMSAVDAAFAALAIEQSSTAPRKRTPRIG